MQGKIPATVVTGFLGAGKTTLIRHLIENANGRRIALIINEFGDLGVDGEIIKGCGIEGCAEDDIVELSNGCICCTVAEDFIPAMEKLIAQVPAPDHIVIETSGLALPQPLVRAFNWPEVRSKVTVDGVVAVVDGPAYGDGQFAADPVAVDVQRGADDNLDHETPLSELFEDQIGCADMIIVNKADVLGDAAGAMRDRLSSQARNGVSVLTASHGQIAPSVLLGMGIGAEDDLSARHEVHHHHHHHDDEHEHDHDHSHEHGHDEFESFVVDLPELPDRDRFLSALDTLIRTHDVLRLKGFASLSGKPMRLVVQAVGPRIESYFDRPAGAERASRMVVIGQAGLDRIGIEAALKAAAA